MMEPSSGFLGVMQAGRGVGIPMSSRKGALSWSREYASQPRQLHHGSSRAPGSCNNNISLNPAPPLPCPNAAPNPPARGGAPFQMLR